MEINTNFSFQVVEPTNHLQLRKGKSSERNLHFWGVNFPGSRDSGVCLDGVFPSQTGRMRSTNSGSFREGIPTWTILLH